MQRLQGSKGRIAAVRIEDMAKRGNVILHKKKLGVVKELAGKYKEIGKKLAKEGKTGVGLMREARDEIWESKRYS